MEGVKPYYAAMLYHIVEQILPPHQSKPRKSKHASRPRSSDIVVHDAQTAYAL